MTGKVAQLISYIAPAAPATRRPAEGDLPLLRPEIGFTPKWYREKLGIDFGARWHADPLYRREAVLAMRGEIRRRFPGASIGGVDRPDAPLDILTGLFGTCSVAAIYGVPIVYSEDGWPDSERRFLSDAELDGLRCPDLDLSDFFQGLMDQVEQIASLEGRVVGYINWQGILNNAQRLRGEDLFADMVEKPERARHLFDCVSTTMVNAARRLHARQRDSGVSVDFFTVSNCLVNMVSPDQYGELLLSFDRRIAGTFGSIGVHNCAWSADPYIDHYAEIPNLSYIDMGIESDLPRARDAFPDARRAIMYTPTDVAGKTADEIRADLERVVRDFAPCDLVLADIEAGTPDSRVLGILDLCEELNRGGGSL